jgi:hypothetical protein
MGAHIPVYQVVLSPVELRAEDVNTLHMIETTKTRKRFGDFVPPKSKEANGFDYSVRQSQMFKRFEAGTSRELTI